MAVRIRKSLFGYRRESVMDAMKSMEQSHLEKKKELHARIDLLKAERRRLTAELEQLRRTAPRPGGGTPTGMRG